MAAQTHLPSVIESESSLTTGASSNVPLAGTQKQHTHQLVHRDAEIAATEIMAQDTYLKST